MCGDEVFVGYDEGHTFGEKIRVLSLDGKLLRTIDNGGWLCHHCLCCVDNHLYITECPYDDTNGEEWEREEDRVQRRTCGGRRVFELSPEGEVLQVFKSPKPAGWPDEEHVHWTALCGFDGKLLMGSEYNGERYKLVALKKGA